MSFDTTWDISKYKVAHETEEHWQLREKFLIAHKDKFPENQLACLAQTFFNVEILRCKYSQETMELIERLSKGVADEWRESRKTKLQPTFVTASDAVKTKGNIQAAMLLSSNEMPVQSVKYILPYDPNYVILGFFLFAKDNLESYEIVSRSCIFSKSSKDILFKKQPDGGVRACLYIQQKLVAHSLGTSKKAARKAVFINAHDYLKKFCFTIKEKGDDVVSSVNKNDVVPSSEDNSIDNSNTLEVDYTAKQKKINSALPDDNIDNKLLQMGWKTDSGLGKNEQGRIDPVEVVQLPKNMGLGNNTSEVVEDRDKQKMMNALQGEINKHLKAFVDGPKKKLIFSTEFTKDERKLIHLSCKKFGVKTKSYGSADCRHVVITKKQSAREIFEELINSDTHENDYYILIPPSSQNEENTVCG